MRQQLDKAKNLFLDLLFPKFCFGCKKEGFYICADCAGKLTITHYSFCPTCKNKTPDFQKCKHHKTYLNFFLSPFSYDNTLIKDLLHNFKYEFVKDIGPELANFQIQAIQNSSACKIISENPQNFLIVPVPLHKKRLSWRGFNQSEILAKEISKKLNIDLSDSLKKIRHTKPQIEMIGQKEREQNIRGVFICEDKKIKGKIVILIDDMITTGATMEECARILKKSGAEEVWGLTVAK